MRSSTIPAPMNRLMLDYNVLYIVLVAAGLVFFGAVFLSTRPAQRAKPVKHRRLDGPRGGVVR